MWGHNLPHTPVEIGLIYLPRTGGARARPPPPRPPAPTALISVRQGLRKHAISNFTRFKWPLDIDFSQKSQNEESFSVWMLGGLPASLPACPSTTQTTQTGPEVKSLRSNQWNLKKRLESLRKKQQIPLLCAKPPLLCGIYHGTKDAIRLSKMRQGRAFLEK